jgi:hypothetical protein
MASPKQPAAYARRGGAADRRALAQAADQRGWPAPALYADDALLPADRYGPALDQIAAAITTGRHDALLLPMPATVSDHARLARLLRSCTMHGVTVSLVLLAGEAWPDGLPIPSGKARRT